MLFCVGTIDKITSKMKEVADFRKLRGQRYRLYNLLTISILAMVAGADDYEAMAAFAASKEDFLVENGLLDGKRRPSHDIFRWVFKHLNAEGFSLLLGVWLEQSVEKARFQCLENAKVPMPKRIHIDGKSLRATRTNEHTRSALQVVSAYLSDYEMCAGQLLIDGKSCEKAAIPQLIEVIDLKNAIVTIDAVGTMKKVATKIIDKGGDYVLALKKNNRLFYQEVEDFFKVFDDTKLVSFPFETSEKSHGRHEKRVCQVISDLQYFPDAQDWKGIKSLVRIQTEQTRNGKLVKETRFYISSLPPNAKDLLEAVRKHWSVENNLHWSLDVSFNEDKSRVKDKNAATILAALRRFALALINNIKISKNSVKSQRLQAGWNNQFLLKVFKLLN